LDCCAFLDHGAFGSIVAENTTFQTLPFCPAFDSVPKLVVLDLGRVRRDASCQRGANHMAIPQLLLPTSSQISGMDRQSKGLLAINVFWHLLIHDPDAGPVLKGGQKSEVMNVLQANMLALVDSATLDAVADAWISVRDYDDPSRPQFRQMFLLLCPDWIEPFFC
jgi:hypothetical protein